MQGELLMPARMQTVIRSVVANDWFSSYQTLEGIGSALDRIASRIRFVNNFRGSLEDIEENAELFEQIFLQFFPLLMNHVKNESLEPKHKA